MSASTPWFHVETGGALASGRVDLDPLEVRHASGARRLRDGDAVVLFDGRGGLADGMLCEQGRAADAGPWRQVPAPRPRVSIAAAIPKGDRSAVMIDMATQLGLAEFIPLRCERAVTEASPNLLLRLGRVAVEACKQSKRPHVPAFRQPMDVEECARRAAAGEAVLVADVSGPDIDAVAAGAEEILVVVGPEGGLSPPELEALRRSGCPLASLSDGILRIEAAVVVAVARARRAAQRAAGR